MTLRINFNWIILLWIGCGVASFSACTTAYRKSVGADADPIISKVFIVDYNVAWQSVLDSLKSARLDISNREAGVVQTKWIDNTPEKNNSESDVGVVLYTKAQVRFRVNLMKGFSKGYPSIKVSVQKEQVAQRDALDDLRPQESDGVEEKTLLYRIARLIKMKKQLTLEEERRTQKELNKSEFNSGSSSGSSDLEIGNAPHSENNSDDLSLESSDSSFVPQKNSSSSGESSEP